MKSSQKETAGKLSPIGAGVARSLALGLDYDDIAVTYGLSVDQIAKVARGNLVKKRTVEISKEIDDRVIEEAAGNPVRQYLAGKGMKAAQSLVTEMSNTDREEGGATASTRIAASKAVLELGGNSAPQETNVSAVIMVSADKVNMGKTIINKVMEDVPDFVDG